jgi:hypothetical protein
MTSIHRRLIVVASAIMALAIASHGLAQTPQGRGQGPMYNVATETTVKGSVQNVETVSGGGGGRGRQGLGGLHLTLKTSAETLNVHLGPVAFLAERKLTIATGDALDIVGSRVTVDGEAVMIAKTVTKGGTSYTLRDASGRPLWSGGAR